MWKIPIPHSLCTVRHPLRVHRCRSTCNGRRGMQVARGQTRAMFAPPGTKWSGFIKTIILIKLILTGRIGIINNFKYGILVNGIWNSDTGILIFWNLASGLLLEFWLQGFWHGNFGTRVLVYGYGSKFWYLEFGVGALYWYLGSSI